MIDRSPTKSLRHAAYLCYALGALLACAGGPVAAAAAGDPYTWPPYNPTISYNFKDEFPNLSMPTKDLDVCSGVAGSRSDGWWTFKWGSDKNSLVTSAAINPASGLSAGHRPKVLTNSTAAGRSAPGAGSSAATSTGTVFRRSSANGSASAAFPGSGETARDACLKA